MNPDPLAPAPRLGCFILIAVPAAFWAAVFLIAHGGFNAG